MPSNKRNYNLLGFLTVLTFRLKQPLKRLEKGAVMAIMASAGI